MSTSENKVCDACGVEIPDSADPSMSDVETYWCDECEYANRNETDEELMQRLADREALGLEPRHDNPVFKASRDRSEEDRPV